MPGKLGHCGHELTLDDLRQHSGSGHLLTRGYKQIAMGHWDRSATKPRVAARPIRPVLSPAIIARVFVASLVTAETLKVVSLKHW